MRFARTTASFLALSIALSSIPAFASNESDAKDLFARGRELRQKGDCAGAVPLFQKAFQLYPQGLGSLRNLAECEEQIGKFASARRDWLEMKRALLVNKDAKYEGWDADADAAAARLAPKIASLTLAVTVVTQEGAGPLAPDMPIKVLVNGEQVDPKLVDVPLDRDPGTYVVRIGGGTSIVQKSVTLAAGDKKTLELKVELPNGAPPEPEPQKTKETKKDQPPPSTSSSSSSSSSGSALKTAGFVSLGIGGAAVVGTVIAIALRASAKSDLEADCPSWESGRCTNPAARDDADRGSRAATMANVFGGIAIVGLGIGAGLVIAGSSAEKKTGVKLAPWAGAGGGGATLWGAF